MRNSVKPKSSESSVPWVKSKHFNPGYALSASKAWLKLVFGEHVYRGMNQGQLS